MKFIHLPTEIEAKRAEKNTLLHIPGGQILVWKGEWIVTEGNRKWKISDEDFWKLYRPLEKEKKDVKT